MRALAVVYLVLVTAFSRPAPPGPRWPPEWEWQREWSAGYWYWERYGRPRPAEGPELPPDPYFLYWYYPVDWDEIPATDALRQIAEPVGLRVRLDARAESLLREQTVVLSTGEDRITASEAPMLLMMQADLDGVLVWLREGEYLIVRQR